MSPHLSRHVDNDDMRHYAFTRDSKIPYGSFHGTPAWMTSKRWRWGAIAVLALAVVGAIFVHADRPDSAIRVTAHVAR